MERKTIPNARPDLLDKVDNFVKLLNEHERNRHEDGSKKVIYDYEVLKKKIRVRFVRSNYFEEEMIVYCFIDHEGNLLYAHSWLDIIKNKPIRGSVYNENPLEGTELFSLKKLK